MHGLCASVFELLRFGFIMLPISSRACKKGAAINGPVVFRTLFVSMWIIKAFWSPHGETSICIRQMRHIRCLVCAGVCMCFSPGFPVDAEPKNAEYVRSICHPNDTGFNGISVMVTDVECVCVCVVLCTFTAYWLLCFFISRQSEESDQWAGTICMG